MRFLLPLLFLSLLAEPLWAKEIFQESDHCVAWKAKKVLFILNTVYPVGKNCRIQVGIVKKGTKKAVKLELNHKDFQSGEEDRDEVVSDLLGGDESQNVIFESEALEPGNFRKLTQGEIGILRGEIKFAGRSYPLKFAITKSIQNGKKIFTGQTVTDFSSMKIKVPNLVGGLVSKVSDYLELHFQFQESLIH